jgi:hypothetical protein
VTPSRLILFPAWTAFFKTLSTLATSPARKIGYEQHFFSNAWSEERADFLRSVLLLGSFRPRGANVHRSPALPLQPFILNRKPIPPATVPVRPVPSSLTAQRAWPTIPGTVLRRPVLRPLAPVSPPLNTVPPSPVLSRLSGVLPIPSDRKFSGATGRETPGGQHSIDTTQA